MNRNRGKNESGIMEFAGRGLVGCLLACTLVCAVHGQSLDRKRFLRWSYQDLASVYENRQPIFSLYLGGSLALFGSFTVLDRTIHNELVEGYHGIVADYANVANQLGGPYANIPVATIFLVSLATPYQRFQDAAFTSLESLVYSGALNYTIKLIAGRVRPEDSSNPFIFKPFSGNSSFPSGHANAVFAILTPWVLYYPHPITYTLYVLGAGGCAIARIGKEKHWASDVITGGAMGFLSSYFLTRRHKQLQHEEPPDKLQLSLVPQFGFDSFSLSLNARF